MAGAQTVGSDDTLDAGDAVTLLRISGLDDPILHEIWEQSDLDGEGYLNKTGFKMAMKFVALAQQGDDISLDNLGKKTALADLKAHTDEFAHLAKPKQNTSTAKASSGGDVGDGWAITPAEKARFDESFAQLGPTADGLITGKKARKVLMKTGLPQVTLGKIWDAADIDGDGNLDKDEFAVAMHLIRMCMGGQEVPSVLPTNLVPPSKRSASAAASAETSSPAPEPVSQSVTPQNPPKPAAAPAEQVPSESTKPARAQSTDAGSDWVVKKGELKTYEEFFRTADKDKDGMVSGKDVMKIFLTSKLSKDVLAHVWQLVDVDNSGEINCEQFALAMHFIAEKVRGKSVPTKLLPHHIPPSMRHRYDSAGTLRPRERLSPSKDGNEAETLAQANAELKKEIQNTNAEISKESDEVDGLTAEVKALRNEEKKLRAELKAGKEKLMEILAKKRKAKQDKKRIEGKIDALRGGISKVHQGLQAAQDSVSSGAGDATGNDHVVETHGMSMEDYFGQ